MLPSCNIGDTYPPLLSSSDTQVWRCASSVCIRGLLAFLTLNAQLYKTAFCSVGMLCYLLPVDTMTPQPWAL